MLVTSFCPDNWSSAYRHGDMESLCAARKFVSHCESMCEHRLLQLWKAISLVSHKSSPMNNHIDDDLYITIFDQIKI